MADDTKPIPRSERYARARDQYNPPHTKTAYIPIYTPPDVRIGLAAMLARYVGRGALGTITDSGFPEPLKENTINRITKPIVNRSTERVDRLLSDSKYSSDISRAMGNTRDNMVRALRSTDSGKELHDSIRKELGKWGAGGRTNNLIEYALDHGRGGVKPRVTNQSIKNLVGDVNKLSFHYGYDLGLGAVSVYMSNQMNQRVKYDMKQLYSEAVAYELGKDPSEVSYADLKHSENRIVNVTVKNYERKRAMRFGTDALFFLRLPFRWVAASDMAIGAKGAMWFSDVWGRKPTMLESLTYFVNDKLNPEYGISDPISKGDIINFYQQYVTLFTPEKAFRSLMSGDPTDARVWAQAEPIFYRITELMNLTYNYKHMTQLDNVTGHPVASANFPLPKFIYMLGHDMIDPHDPVKTLAFVEIANLHGMDALKEADKAFRNGATLREVIEKFPVSLDALQADMTEALKAPVESSSALSTGALAEKQKPDAKVQEVLEAAPLKEKEQHLSHA